METKPTHVALHLGLPLACSSRKLTTNVFKSPASSFSRSSSRRLLPGAVSAATRISARVLISGCRFRLLTSLVAICFWSILQSDSVQSTSDFISRISAEATAVSQQKHMPERAARHAAVVIAQLTHMHFQNVALPAYNGAALPIRRSKPCLIVERSSALFESAAQQIVEPLCSANQSASSYSSWPSPSPQT